MPPMDRFMTSIGTPLLLIIALAACDRAATNSQNEMPAVKEVPVNEPEANPDPVVDVGEAGGPADDGNLIEEGPTDPKSALGAAQVLQRYATLLEQGRAASAYRLWSDGGGASGLSEREFAEAFGKYTEVHAEIGAPGSMEGAAGSAYVEIPVRFYGRLRSGAPFSSTGTATLRRVNDVPGSTQEQRRWRIYRIGVQPPL